MPIIAQGNVDFQAALISVAFTESEQRSLAAKFTMLDGTLLHSQENILKIITADNTQSMTIESMPDITVRDLVDWLDRFAKTEGPIQIADSGTFGLNCVLDEADLLFWTFVPIIWILGSLDSTQSTSRPMLMQVLSNERVRWALDNLLDQLKALADLAPDKMLARYMYAKVRT